MDLLFSEMKDLFNNTINNYDNSVISDKFDIEAIKNEFQSF
jgi:hypothetical protein